MSEIRCGEKDFESKSAGLDETFNHCVTLLGRGRKIILEKYQLPRIFIQLTLRSKKRADVDISLHTGCLISILLQCNESI